MADNTNVTIDAQPQTVQAYINPGAHLVSYAIDPADTPILFRLRSLALPTPVNRYAFARTVFTNLLWDAGASITIYARTFIAARYPAAGEFFDSDAADMGTVVDSICVAINEDPFLGNLYSATRNEFGGNIYLEIVAKQQGSAFNLVLGATLNSSIANFAARTTTAITGDKSRAQQLQQWGYGFMIKVLVPSEPMNFFDTANSVPGTARWIEIGTLAKDSGGSATVDFDVSRYVRPYANIALPDPVTPFLQRFAQAAAAYKIQWGEYYRGGLNTAVTPNQPALALDDANFAQTQPIFYRSGESAIRWAAPGAFRLDAIPADYAQWWKSAIRGGGTNTYGTVLPLTERPINTLVRRTLEPSWLYFWLVVDNRTVPCQVRTIQEITYHDGTTVTSTGGQFPVSDSGLCCLPYTPNLQLVEAIGKRVANWTATVQVKHGLAYVNLCSQSFTLDTSTDPKRYKTFYWENRFGTLDNFTFEGVEQVSVEKAAVSYTRGIGQNPGLNTATGKTRTFESQTVTRQTVVSGWVDRAHMDYLAGMLRARNVWIVETVSYFDATVQNQTTRRAFVSVIFGNHDWKADAREKLFELSIEWVRAIPENVLQA